MWRAPDGCAPIGQPRPQPGQPAQDPDEVVAEVARIRAARDAARQRHADRRRRGHRLGCTLQGEVAESEVLRLMQALLDAGADRVSLADTVGFADPASVQRLFAKARALVGDRLACAHFHDTRGMGLANAYAAWQTGITRFDACLAGIGGCPTRPAPAATSPPKTWNTCCSAWALPRAWMCPRCWRCASACGLAGGRDPARRPVAGGPARHAQPTLAAAAV